MQARTGRSRAGAAMLLMAGVAAVSTPPLLLAAAIGNPLPSWPVEWTRVVESIRFGLIPSSVWVNALALVAWTAWALLLGMLTIEVVAVARNRPSRAGVPGWVRHLAQVLVAAAFTLAGPGQYVVAIGASAAPVAVAAAPAAASQVRPPAQTQSLAEGRMITVGEEDSWGGFAADALGDAALGPMLRAANLGRQVGDRHTISESTAFVEPGWQLLVPADIDSHPPATGTEATTDAAESHSWEVAKGDHFWGMAEATLAEAWGRLPTDGEVAPYWRQVVEANRDGLLPPGDPNLIYPGQRFTVPSPPPDPDRGSTDPPTSDPTSPSDHTEQATDDEPASGGAGSQEPPDAAASLVTPPEEQAAGVDARGGSSAARAAPEERSGWRSAIDDSDTSGSGDSSTRALDPVTRTALGVPAGLTAGVAASCLLAAGVLATLRWRRRARLQQRTPGLRLPTPLADSEAEVAKLDAAAAPEETLDDLAALLASVPLHAHPVLVRACDDGQVVLLFDEHDALPEPPAPWTLADDGTDGPVGWQARLGDRGSERSFGIPLLVTLGRAGTSTVLANVGAMATLALTGPPAEVRRRLRAISLDLATSRVSFPVEVAIAGDERLASLDRVRQIDDPGDEVELALAEADEVVIDDRVPRLLVCHPGTVPPEVPDTLVGMVGVVAAEAPTAGGWVLDLDDARTGRLRLPDGGAVGLALPDVDLELIDDELDALAEPASPQRDEPPDEAAAAGVDPSTNGKVAHRPAPPTEPVWCEVRLLGPVEVLRGGARVDGLTPGTLEILVYLATHRDGVPKSRLDDVLWAGTASRSGTQRVTSALTKLRKVLGDGPDGKPLLPRRSGDQPIVLSEHLGTDLDRALAHLAVAQHLPAELLTREVAAALELVRGEPLEGRAYSWASDIAQRAIVQLQDAALDLARTCREAGDLDTADWAIQQGLKLLDPNGWLYLERAHLERLRGHPEQPPRIFEQYRRKLADDADEIAGTVTTPPPEIELAFRALMAGV